MNNYRKHAMKEFEVAGWLDEDGKFKDDMQEMICNHVLKLLDVFNGEGHSGTSAPYAVNLFKRLALFKTIAPLTGEDDEWCEMSEGIFQNKRESAVFKEENSQAYYADGIVFIDENDCSFTSNNISLKDGTKIRSRQYIKEFPFTPKTFYVDVVGHTVKDESQLQEVFDYYAR